VSPASPVFHSRKESADENGCAEVDMRNCDRLAMGRPGPRRAPLMWGKCRRPRGSGSIAELVAEARQLAERRLPALKALQIV